jgi:hypothetical protein
VETNVPQLRQRCKPQTLLVGQNYPPKELFAGSAVVLAALGFVLAIASEQL